MTINAGKGDDWRMDVNFNKYWTNFPTLSGEIKTTAKKITKKNGKTTYTYGK
jgi:hypothetical protein